MAFNLVATTYIEAMLAPAGGGAEIRQRIGEVRSWSDSSGSSGTDISIIGRVDANDKPIARTRAGAGEETVTLECYLDLADYPQSQLQKDAVISKILVGEVGVANDLVVYSDCTVSSRNRSGTEYNGLVGVSLTISVSGGILEDQTK